MNEALINPNTSPYQPDVQELTQTVSPQQMCTVLVLLACMCVQVCIPTTYIHMYSTGGVDNCDHLHMYWTSQSGLSCAVVEQNRNSLIENLVVLLLTMSGSYIHIRT